MIDSKVLKVLEFDKVLKFVKNYLVIPGSEQILDNEIPSSDFLEAKKRLDLTKEADKVLSDYNTDPLYSCDDISMSLKKASKMSILTISEIIRVGKVLRTSRIFKTGISSLEHAKDIPQLKAIASLIFVDKKLEDEISRCFVTDEMVSDTATPRLYDIRRKIRRCNEDIKEKLNSIIRGAEYKKYLQDSLVTVRGGRYVVPVRQEFKNQISGMLHDRSDTGATVYIEPAAAVELNNELKLLLISEQQEIEQILRDFTAQISAASGTLLYNIENLCDADLAFAKAKYSHTVRGIYPNLNSIGKIIIVNGRHPLIAPEKMVPVNVTFGTDYDLLIITGPNTGGKTVTLKLSGLFCIMAMCGYFVPASDGTELSVFDNIFADIGDEQSIESSLSTFSSHIRSIVHMVDNISESSLILLDELGVGTDPVEGAALAVSIIEYLEKYNCKGIITSHFNEVKEYAYSSSKTKNASMQFDPVNLTPTYRLSIGIPGSSNAFEIGRKLGIKQDIIDRAYLLISNEKLSFDRILKEAERARINALEELKQSEIKHREAQEALNAANEKFKLIAHEREKLATETKQNFKKLYMNAAAESEELIEEMKAIIAQAEISEYDIVRAKQIANKLEDKRYSYESGIESTNNVPSEKIISGDIVKGSNVFIKKLAKTGIVQKISGEKILVDVGGFVINCEKQEVDLVEKTKKTKGNNPNSSNVGVTILRQYNMTASSNEIKLLGKTVLEAIDEIEQFIPACISAGFKECKIIHGTGTGALRKGIWDYLKHHDLVDKYRYGLYGEGERGVTIISFK